MRVLVFDPNPWLGLLLSRELDAAGLSTLGACTTNDAMKLLVEDSPNAVVVNATRVGHQGAEFIRSMREMDSLRGIPIVAIASDVSSESRLVDAGADRCVRTPMKKGDLRNAVDWALSVYRERSGP